MARIAFIGLGHMGLPMARNLLAAGHDVTGFDLSEPARAALVDAGGHAAPDAGAAVARAEVVVTALPAARHVEGVCLGEGGLLAGAPRGTLFIDCTTVDPETARRVAAEAAAAGQAMVDSPMSGGVAGAQGGTLTFMVGGPEAAVARARPVLESMGRTVHHAGESGAGAAAKLCNNLMLAIQMISVAEGMNLARTLGLDPQKLYDISSTATARCWSLNDYCPEPGPVPAAPSNRGYAPGFAVELMAKDLRLAMEAATAGRTSSPLGAEAAQIYALMELAGHGPRDFSSVIRFLRGETVPD